MVPGVRIPGEQSERLSEALGLHDPMQIYGLVPRTFAINGNNHARRYDFVDVLCVCTASTAAFFEMALRLRGRIGKTNRLFQKGYTK